jgi:hypothetical protein
MTSLKLINIYINGFRACHYDKLSSAKCPYPTNTQEANHWQKGYEYAATLDKILAASLKTAT